MNLKYVYPVYKNAAECHLKISKKFVEINTNPSNFRITHKGSLFLIWLHVKIKNQIMYVFVDSYLETIDLKVYAQRKLL